MTAMINAVKNILTTPLLSDHDDVDGVWVHCWTESRALPPPVPSWDDAASEEPFDGQGSAAA